MANSQCMRPKIVTIRSTEPATTRCNKDVREALYEFYLCFGDALKSECAQGGKIVSVKNMPKSYSELAGAYDEAQREDEWAKIGKIQYEIFYKFDAMTDNYVPKKFLKNNVVKLGYYLDSISTSDVVREYRVSTISTTCEAKRGRIVQLARVLGVNATASISIPAREYLRGMGRSIREKVEMSRKREGISAPARA